MEFTWEDLIAWIHNNIKGKEVIFFNDKIRFLRYPNLCCSTRFDEYYKNGEVYLAGEFIKDNVSFKHMKDIMQAIY